MSKSNKQVRAMIKSITVRSATNMAVQRLLAGGGEALGRSPALECWVALTPYYEGHNFSGWGNYAQARVEKNANGTVNFRTVDGTKVIVVKHEQLYARVEVSCKRPNSDALAQRSARWMRGHRI